MYISANRRTSAQHVHFGMENIISIVSPPSNSAEFGNDNEITR